ncbi:hypothetical protein ABPG74_017928 [Tetrahymena malaccensis]
MSISQQNNNFSYQIVSFDSKNGSKVPIALKNIQYNCQIINNILKTSLTQTFINESSSNCSDTIYYFPIEDNICLQSFQAKYDTKTIKGIVKEKKEALNEYQQNKISGNLVSYAEIQTIQNQYYCEIELGNLKPNQKVEILITFSSQINCILNKYYVARIPLQYIEDEISAKMGKNLLTLELFCTGRIKYAETRGIQTEKLIINENLTKFNLKQTTPLKEIEYFDLVYQFQGMFEPQVIFGKSKLFNEEQVKQDILGIRHSAMISFIPNFNQNISCEIDDVIKAAISNEKDIMSDEFQQVVNQELVDNFSQSKSEFIFLLDRSGSMEGLPITKAREALILFLQSLPSDSYFNIFSFGSKFEMLFTSSRKYNNQNMEIAINIISSYKADLVGTEIYNPLSCIFAQKRIQKYNRQIFLLTDGQVKNSFEILNLIKKNNQFDRVHSIGFGSDTDKNFINKSAQYGKGISKIVDFKSDLSSIVLQMLFQSLTPTLSEFKILYDQSIIDSSYPFSNHLPFVIKDEIINIHLFFKPGVDLSDLNDEQKKIKIEYYDSVQDKVIYSELVLIIQDIFNCNHELQETVFKIGKQLFLNEKGSQKNQIDEVIQQSIDYQILTQETALICVVEELDDLQRAKFEASYKNQFSIPPAPPLFIQNGSPICIQHQKSSVVSIYISCDAPPPPPLKLPIVKTSPIILQNNEIIQQSLDYQILNQESTLIGVVKESDDQQKPKYEDSYYNQISIPPAPPLFIQNNIPLPIQRQDPSVVSIYLSCDAPSPPPINLPFIKTQPLLLQFNTLPPPPPASDVLIQQRLLQKHIKARRKIRGCLFDSDDDSPLKYQPIQKISQTATLEQDFNQHPQQISHQIPSYPPPKPQAPPELPPISSIGIFGIQQPTHVQKIQQNQRPQNNTGFFHTNNSILFSQNCKIQVLENEDQNNAFKKEQISINFQNMQIADFLRLSDSQGVWKFNQTLINQYLRLENNIYEQVYQNFLTKDAFMTLLMVIILEIKYSDQKSKWLLISKKSLVYIKSQIKQGYELQVLKQQIQKLVES